MSTQIAILMVFIVYFGIIVTMALRFRKSKNLADYLLAGRSLNTWVGALSAQTSDMSGWLLMGLPGAIYAAGIGRAWIAVGLITGTILNWLLVAKRLRRYTIVANNSVTLPEYFENRFHDTSHVLKISAAVFFAIFFTVYAASGFVAGGTLLPRIFDVSYPVSVLIVASIVILYTLVGGLMAISWTDSVQGMLMLFAVFFLPIVVISAMGGWGNVSADIPAGFFNMMSDGAGDTIKIRSIISDVAWGLGYFGMPHILIKLIAIRKERYVNRSAIIAIVWVVLALFSAVMVGLVGSAFIPGLDLPETIFIRMVNAVLIDNGAILAVFLGGLFLCGMFAAIKSTADSQLLVGSSAICDIYKQANNKVSDKHLVWFSRGAVLVVALLAVWSALDAYDRVTGGVGAGSGVMVLVSNAWAGFGAAFGPLVLCSLFWKRANRGGAIAGVVTGGLIIIIWEYIPLISGQTLGAATGLYSLVPGFLLSFAAIIIASLLTRKPSQKMLDEFEKASHPLIED
jgi:sodium/proline symporter